MEKQTINKVYFHIGNGGVTFSVTNGAFGASVEVEACHFGNVTNYLSLHVDPKDLKKLGEMFIKSSEFDGFNETYCCAAKYHDINEVKCTGSEGENE